MMFLLGKIAFMRLGIFWRAILFDAKIFEGFINILILTLDLIENYFIGRSP